MLVIICMMHSRSSSRQASKAGRQASKQASKQGSECCIVQVVGGDKCPIVDTYWQTETGAHVLAPLPGVWPAKPGSATLPFFGVQPAMVNEQVLFGCIVNRYSSAASCSTTESLCGKQETVFVGESHGICCTEQVCYKAMQRQTKISSKCIPQICAVASCWVQHTDHKHLYSTCIINHCTYIYIAYIIYTHVPLLCGDCTCHCTAWQLRVCMSLSV